MGVSWTGARLRMLEGICGAARSGQDRLAPERPATLAGD
jgi:hypothetical protein